MLWFLLLIFSLLTSTKQKLSLSISLSLPSSSSTFLSSLLHAPPLLFFFCWQIQFPLTLTCGQIIIKLKNYVISYTTKQAFESQISTLHFGRAASAIFQSYVCKLLKFFQTAGMWSVRTLCGLVYLRSRWSFTVILITT